MTRGLMLGGENSEFQVIDFFFALYLKTITRNFSESTKSLTQKTLSKFVWFLSKPRINEDFNNFVKDALSEFLVIVFWYKAINDNSEPGIFLESMIFLEFEQLILMSYLFPHRVLSGFGS